MQSSAAAGTNGFLFCDLRGYTAFVEARGDQAAADLLATYRALVRAAIATHAGAEIKTEGDSVYVVFPAASAAVEAGLEIVAAAAEASTRDAPIRVGVGVHAGETVATTEGLVGGAVNIAARVCAKAQAGEVLVTDTVRALTRTYLPYRYTSLGTQQLKGIAGGIPLYRVEAVPSSGRARLTRQLGARRGRVIVLAGLVVVALVAATGVYALNRPPDCLTLPASTKDVVAKIDPARNCVVAVYQVGYSPGPMVSTADAVWVANIDDQTVSRIDPKTGEVRTTSARGTISGFSAASDGVWILDGLQGRLTKIASSDARLADTLLLPSTPPSVVGGVSGGSLGGSATPRDTAFTYGDLAAGGGKLWVTSRMEGSVLKIDPRREDVTNAGYFAIERLKVAIPPEPETGFNGALTYAGTGVGLITFADGALWIADMSDAAVWRSEVGTNHVQIVPVAGEPVTTNAIAEASGVVWVLHGDGSVNIASAVGSQSKVVNVGADLVAGAADSTGLWAADGAGALLRIDPTGAVLSRLGLPGRPSGVTFARDAIWVSIRGR